MQVSGDLAGAGKRLGARVLTIYGGRAYEPQIEALRKGVDVVVGTPGRLLDLAQQGHLRARPRRASWCSTRPTRCSTSASCPTSRSCWPWCRPRRQTMLFSATMPGPIVALARQFLEPADPDPRRARHRARRAPSHVDQFAYRAHAMDKVELLARVLQARDRGLTLIFTRTKRTAAEGRRRSRATAASPPPPSTATSARAPASRRCARSAPARSTCWSPPTSPPAASTSRASRTSINYQAPEDEMTYVHRIGRTARAGAPGTAITLVDWDDIPRWKLICDELGLPFHEPVETYSTSPHLYLELDIPEGVRARCRAASAPAPAWTPRSSRTSAAATQPRRTDATRAGTARRDSGTGRRPRGREAGPPATDRRDAARPARARARTRTAAAVPSDDAAGDAAHDSGERRRADHPRGDHARRRRRPRRVAPPRGEAPAARPARRDRRGARWRRGHGSDGA